MLVFSRKIGESFVIGQNIRVTITEIRGGRVRLSIEAPDEVRVVRFEIWTPRSTGDGDEQGTVVLA